MKTSPVRPLAAAVSVLVVAFGAAGCVVSVDSSEYTAREEKRFEVRGEPEVRLVTFDGSVEIRSWDQQAVAVEIEKRGQDKEQAEAIEVRAEQSGDVIRIEVKKPAAGTRDLIGFKVSPSAKIIASVPRKSRIVARSGDGSMSVERIEGTIDIDTGDGSIRGFDLAGNIRIHTGDGSVKLEHVGGSIDVDTADGSVQLSGKLSSVKLRTGDGTVTVRAADGSSMADEWEIRTGDGGVRLEVPAEFAANIDASTGDGRVRLEGLSAAEPEAPSADRDEDERSRREMKVPIGGGGKLLRLRTGSGSISVKRL